MPSEQQEEEEEESAAAAVVAPLFLGLSSCNSTSISVECDDNGDDDHGTYPAALVKYEEVVGNPDLFSDTLSALHKSMGTKFTVPTMGGKLLELHHLFVQVTSRGGLEEVVRKREWKDVISSFNFPATITNASYVLRKYYMALLHHYEQVYYFGAEGRPIITAVNMSRTSHGQEAAPAKTPSAPSVVEPPKGRIDGKFEHGYLVTVVIGSETLHGVLYHSPLDKLKSRAPEMNGSLVAAPPTEHIRKRRRKRRSRKDSFRPKLNRSAYNFFFSEQYAKMQPAHFGKDKGVSKIIGDLWNNLTEEEKAVYKEQGERDKERYGNEIMEYRKVPADRNTPATADSSRS